MSDIYETILRMPECWIEVAKPDGQGGWDNPEALVRLVEKDQGSGDADLFAHVDDQVFNLPSIRALVALFDNYNPFEGQEEVTLEDDAHVTDVNAFLDAVMETAPMRAASEHLRLNHPDRYPDQAAIREWTKKVWFEPFVNEYASPEPHCSGFEYVFVGEVQQGAVSGDNKMDIGGYHSWVKYAHDQKAGLVRYRGHDYRPEVAQQGKAESREASTIMTWDVNGVTYLKNPGGFFVGDLPEMQIALGILGVHDSLTSSFGASAAATFRKIAFSDQSHIDLVVYPQTVREDGNKHNGPHLRSMFPKYRGSGQTAAGPGPAQPHTPQNSGPIRVQRALPNPEGASDETGEWVEIVNATQHDLSLEGWSVRDGQQRSKELAGMLQSGAALRIDLARTDANSVQLTNQGGWIYLYERDQRVAAVRYSQATSGQIIDFF